jgi:4-aminobutyrate aminotransferase-like enzyme
MSRPALPPTAAPLDSSIAPSMRVPPPGPRSRELLDRMDAVCYPGLTTGLAPFVAARKRGWAVEDVDGNVYLDLLSASASVPLGACRDDLIEPAVEMLRRYGNEDSHSLASELMLPLAERLLAIAPSSLSRVDIALNGTEAVEIAIKLMRRATGRPLVISFFGQYHGESTTTAALGAERYDIASGLRQLNPGFVHVPYPHPYRSPFPPPRAGGSGDATVDYLRDQVLFHAVDPLDVAGVMIEPIVGSGGVMIPPDGFWPALLELCREYGWLLCADEVKSGMGRTGTMFAVEHWGVEPDLMCLGKALGGGVMPIGAVLGSERALGSFDDVPTGSTWAWLPAACAAALATLDAFDREPVLENVRALEARAGETLCRLGERHQVVGDVRVKGGYMAVEFVRDRETKQRAPELQEAVAHECLLRGLLADSSTASYNLQPSLVMPVDALDRAVSIVDEAIAAVVERGDEGGP